MRARQGARKVLVAHRASSFFSRCDREVVDAWPDWNGDLVGYV